MSSDSATNIEPELLSLRKKLAMEIESDLKEIEFRKKRVSKNETLLAAVKGSLSVVDRDESKSAGDGYGSKKETVRAAVNSIDLPEFDIDDVEKQLRIDNPGVEINRPRLRTALWTMANDGEIKLVKKGNNKEAAIYARKEKTGVNPDIRVRTRQSAAEVFHSGRI